MKKWTIEFDKKAFKELAQLQPQMRDKFLKFLNKIVLNPRTLGYALRGNLSGLWRYRLGDFRMVCKIQDNILVVLVVAIGHRKDIYH